MKYLFKNAVEVSKRICGEFIKSGDIVADCTMGNGNDTAFLCDLVGNEGKVYAFDVQEQAINNTKDRLEKLGFLDRAELIHDGHENINEYVQEKIKLAIFNLGYLPKGDHSITTKSNTTIEAVSKCLNIIEANGIIILVIYHGHEEGKKEKIELEKFVSTLNQKEYNVAQFRMMNQINNPPEVIFIEKIM